MKTKKNKQNTYTLEELKDKYIGKKGTPDREKFEYELKKDVKREIIKKLVLKESLINPQTISGGER